MQTDFEHPVYSKNVVEFVTVAKEFCVWLESTLSLPRRDFVDTGAKCCHYCTSKHPFYPKRKQCWKMTSWKNL